MNPRTKACLDVCAIIVLLIIAAGCTVILPETQNTNYNASVQVESNGNITVRVQALGEQQRFSVSQYVSYSAKEGYVLAIYEVGITNLDGERQAGNTAFFTLAANEGAVYKSVLSTVSPRVIGQGETISGKLVFEIPHSSMPQSLSYDDGKGKVTVSLPRA